MKKIINYSGIPGLILIAALAFMPVSCSKEAVKDNPEADSSSQLIKVSGEDANAATKTTLEGLATKWVENIDFVGIYSPQARSTSGGTAGVTNRQYKATASASSSAFSPASGQEMYWGTETHNFYAYHPYSATAGSVATTVPITLAAIQTQSAGDNSAHIGVLDFLVATPIIDLAQGTTGGATTVNLHYNHVFTVLEFQIKRSSGSGKITKIKLTAPATNLSLTSGTIDITTATPGAGVSYSISSPVGTKEITLTITGGVTPTADYGSTPKIYMVILPGDFSAERMTIGVEYDDSVGIFKNNVKTGINFERGKKYVVQIDVPRDGDGNTYGTITIGAQVWMASNLKTTKYSNGNPIGTTTSATLDISNATTYPTPKYQWAYAGTESNVATYGRLYTWYAATDTRNVCPTGWHVPADSEWATLTTYLGGLSVAGGQLKETGTSHWQSPNAGATNTSGFTALPGGSRTNDGTFYSIGGYGYWWSSTEGTGTAWGTCTTIPAVSTRAATIIQAGFLCVVLELFPILDGVPFGI